MPETIKTQNLRKEILEDIYELDIPGYLKLEVREITKLLNFYKLNNLYKNIDRFKEYLNKLSENYDQSMLYILNETINNEKTK